MCARCALRIMVLHVRCGWVAARHPFTGHNLAKRLMDTVNHHQADEHDGQLTATDVAAAGTDGAKPRPPTRLILLVRHGETTFNVEGRLPGQLPGVPLTDEGRRQAYQAAVALAAMPLSAVISSPLELSRDTARIPPRGWGGSARPFDPPKAT